MEFDVYTPLLRTVRVGVNASADLRCICPHTDGKGQGSLNRRRYKNVRETFSHPFEVCLIGISSDIHGAVQNCEMFSETFTNKKLNILI